MRCRSWGRMDAHLTVARYVAHLIGVAMRWERKPIRKPESVDEAIVRLEWNKQDFNGQGWKNHAATGTGTNKHMKPDVGTG